jgi:hypothetical protein
LVVHFLWVVPSHHRERHRPLRGAHVTDGSFAFR